MSTRPARVTARVAPRPDVRRWLLIAAALATATAALASAAGAQSAPEQAQAAAIVAESNLHLGTQTGEAVPAALSRASTTAPVGPRVSDGLVTYKPAVSAQAEALTTNERERMRPASRNNAALIVVGLSAMVIGSIVNDDVGSIIVLGGAGLTIYGLWQYLK
jgi:hypothetical protein